MRESESLFRIEANGDGSDVSVRGEQSRGC